MGHIREPKKYFLWIAVILVAAVAGSVSYYTPIGFLWGYLISINLITLLFYWQDKRQAVKSGGRIPEVVLHLLALVGGSIGAFAGQMMFRHKIRKFKFMIVFGAILIVQMAVAIMLAFYR